MGINYACDSACFSIVVSTSGVAGKKSEETRTRILNAALAIFRERGFEQATMREIAQAAEVATGAAYYYFDSKDSLVMAFYERAQVEMRDELVEKLGQCKTLESRLRTIIGEKFEYFAPNRKLLGALSSHADPEHPLSPFSPETKHIRDLDIASFEQLISQARVRVPRDLAPYLPGLLWFFQMGVILFWVTDDSAQQRRTAKLLPLACKVVSSLVRISSLPLMRPLRRPVVNMIEIVVEEQPCKQIES